MQNNTNYRKRIYFVILILLICVLALLWRLIDLGIFKRAFLLKQSDARTLRIVNIPAYRGMITDRNGTPLAISTPVDSVWVNPPMFQPSTPQLHQLSTLLNMQLSDVKQHLHHDKNKEFVYLKRALPPETAEKIKALNIPGLFFQREYRRYYPEGEVATHVIGFTNIDDVGAEGLELGYDKGLRGILGKEQVLKDRLGHIIAIMNVISSPVQGQDLTLSLDDRIQYLAYKNLKDAVEKYHADAGSVVVLNPKTGEILAMANLPSYNPNRRPLIPDSRYRNRAVTDVFEPGSTMKPFSMINALSSGKYTPDSKVDTNPGKLMIAGYTITDDQPNNGIINFTQVIQKSSNIGIAKITLSLPPQSLFDLLTKLGFGQSTHSGFPGEVGGILVNRSPWRPITLASLSFGYGISVTALQLAHAYSVIADNGIEVPLTFLKQTKAPLGQQIISPQVAQEILTMLEAVVQPGGTATAAAIPGYRIAGKTGTSYVANAGGYYKDRYNASFVGIAPVSQPQLVTVVTLHGIQGDIHMGGQIAAPVFANIMSAALRILDIQPDNLAAISKQKTNT